MSATSAPTLQLIQADSTFNPRLASFMKANGFNAAGRSYSVVSIIGGQSTGKSTLLNNLFGTDFATMDAASGRKQTTKGIWVGKADGMDVLVLDVEGTDGREAWEDNKTFENRTALFSLALTDVLMMNIWEKEVGRFSAANIPLLKTIFEALLKLFEGGQHRDAKVLLLFVARDCEGLTPPESLRKTITDDLNRVWNEIGKPEKFAETPLLDFFDVEVAPLPHYRYQTDQWMEEVKNMQHRFSRSSRADYVFTNRKGKSVPAEGFAEFAEQLWTAIENDDDLDLPSQRKMLASFRCQAISKTCMDRFTVHHMRQLQSPLDLPGAVTEAQVSSLCAAWSSSAAQAFNSVLELFSDGTAGYDTDVREEAQSRLEHELGAEFSNITATHAQSVRRHFLSMFQEAVDSIDTSPKALSEFADKLTRLQISWNSSLQELLTILCPACATLDVQDQTSQFEEEMLMSTSVMREKFALRLVDSAKDGMRERLGATTVQLLSQGPSDMWGQLRENCSEEVEKAVATLKGSFISLDGRGISDETKQVFITLAREILLARTRERVNNSEFQDRLFAKFDGRFNKGRARAWLSWDNVEKEFSKAQACAQEYLSLFDCDEAESSCGQAVMSADERKALEDIADKRFREEFSWAQQRKNDNSSRTVWLVTGWGLAILLGADNFVWLLQRPMLLLLVIVLAVAAAVVYFQRKTGSAMAILSIVAAPLAETLQSFADTIDAKPKPARTSSSSSTSSSSRKSKKE